MATIERVGLELDSRGAEQSAKRFDESISKAARSLGTLDKGLASSEQRIAQTARQTGSLEKEMRLLVRAQVNQSTQTKRLTGQLFRMEKALRSSAREGRSAGEGAERGARGINALSRAAGRAQAAMRGLGGPVTRIAALFGAGFGARLAVRSLADFEKTLATVGAVSGASAAELERLRGAAADLGATTEFTASAAGDGLLFLARAGFEVDEAIAALPQTLDLATAGALELGQAADIASNVLSQFGLSVLDLDDVTDSLVNVSNSANTSITQLAEALNYAGPIAGSLGITVEETAAALGVLGNSGIQASQAGTNLRGIIAALQSAAPEAKEALVQLGAGIARVNPATQDLNDVLGELATANLDAATAFDVFGRRNAAAVLTLVRGTAAFDDLLTKQKEGADATGDVADQIRDNLSGSISTLTSTLEAAVLQVGEDGLTGNLRDLVDGATETVRKLFDLRSATDEFGIVTDIAATAVEALAAALVISAAASFISFTTSAVRGLAAMVVAAKAAKAEQLALSAAFKSSVPGLLATGIVALIFAMRTLARDADETEQRIRRNVDAVKSLSEAVGRFTQDRANDPIGQSLDVQIARLENEANRLEGFALDLGKARGETALQSAREAIDLQERLLTLQERERSLTTRSSAAPSISVGGAFSGAQTGSRTAEQLGKIRTEIQGITSDLQAGLKVDGARFIDITQFEEITAGLNSTAIGARALTKALDESAEALGGAFEGRLVQVGLLQKAIQTAAEAAERGAQTLRDSDAAAKAQEASDQYTFAIKLLGEELDGNAVQLARRQELLASVAAGAISLGDAEATLTDELEQAAQVERFLSTAKQAGIVVSEKAREEAERQITEQIKLRRQLGEQAAVLGEVERAEQALRDESNQLALALSAEAAAFQQLDPLQAAVQTQLEALALATEQGGDGFEDLAAKIRKAADALRDAQDASKAGAAADSFSSLKRQLDRDFERLSADAEGRARIAAEDSLLSAGVEDPTQSQIDDIQNRQARNALKQGQEEASAAELERKAIALDRTSDALASAITDAVTAFATGAADISDIGASLLQELQQIAAEAFIGEPLKDALKGVIKAILSSADGNVFTGGGVQPFFQGGVVSSPSLFSFGDDRLGSIAEVGPEAIFPLKRGRDGKLGISGGQSVTFAPRMNITVNGGDAAAVRDGMRKSQRMMMRDFQRRMRGLN